ncbi:MAG: response regulator [Nitrospirae bacterium]|nr:response regulator [Nitrospirota bacterium]
MYIYDVTAVGDGEAALDAARTLIPDIILADVFMPKMDGYELCGKVRQDPALRGIPVVLLAGTFENFDETRAAQVGASGHLTKPFESGELISKVKRLVEQGGSAAGAAVAMPAAATAASAFDEPFGDVALAEEVEEAAAVDDADDLWSVVDMGSPGQPLAGATAAISEDDLWKRANILGDSGETAAFPKEDDSLWAAAAPVAEPEMELAGEMVEDEMMAAEMEDDFPEAALDDTPASDRTAVLDMDSLNLSAYGRPAPQPEPEPVELAEVSGPSEFMAFDGLHQATAAEEHTQRPQPAYAPQPAAAQARPVASAGPALSPEMIREEVARAVGDLLDRKIKEALAGLSSEMIEKVVWEVVPDLAEEILVKEIDRLKAGTS